MTPMPEQKHRDRKLSKEAKTTLINHGIYQFANALSLIFVNLYLWRLTGDLWVNGAYNLIALLSAPLATMYIGKVAKVKDRLNAYRSGIYLTAVFYLLILISQERIVDFYYVFALLKGVSTAFYWLGHFTLSYDVTDNHNRHRYLGWNSMITSASSLFAPIVAGTVIGSFDGLQGYVFVFAFAFLLFLLASLQSLRLKKKPSHRKAYYLKYSLLMMKKRPDFARSLAGWYIVGVPQGILMYVPAILLYHVIPKEHFVGYMNAAFLCLSIVSSYVMAKWGRSEQSHVYLIITAWGFTFASMTLLWEVSLWTVIALMSIHSLFKPLQANSYTDHYYRLIGTMPLREYFRIESIVIRESVINFGRASGVILFMTTAPGIEHVLLPWIIFAAMVIQLAVSPLINRTANKERGVRIESNR